MPLVYFLAHFRKGKYMCKIPLAIRYVYYVAWCILSLYLAFHMPFDLWEKLAERSLILCFFAIFIDASIFMSIAYNVIFKRYTWVQRLLEKE